MPIYQYQCTECEKQLEALQKMSDPKLIECPECLQPTLKKQLTAAAFKLKGTGWYETDFKNSGKKPAAAKSSSIAEGSSNTAEGSSNTAEGSSSTAEGSSSTAEGSSNTAEGSSNRAEGSGAAGTNGNTKSVDNSAASGGRSPNNSSAASAG